MTRLSDARSILAIERAHRGIAFVAFEGGRLTDWGTCWLHRDRTASLDHLLSRLETEVLVIEEATAAGSERRPHVRELLERLARDAEKRGVAVVRVPRAVVRRTWVDQNVTRKESAAAALANTFPELGPLVPPPRKAWQSERVRTDIFDALTLLLHAFPLRQPDGETPVTIPRAA